MSRRPSHRGQEAARQLKEWCRDVLVLGVGGAAAGIRALQQALCHPSHNLFPVGRRQYHSRLFVFDNIDPDSFYGLLDDLELKRLLVNVISKSGTTPATLAKFLFVYNLMQGRLGEAKAKESFLLTTDPGQGGLRRLATEAGLPSLSHPSHRGQPIFDIFRGRFIPRGHGGYRHRRPAGRGQVYGSAPADSPDLPKPGLSPGRLLLPGLYATRAVYPGDHALCRSFDRVGRLVVRACGPAAWGKPLPRAKPWRLPVPPPCGPWAFLTTTPCCPGFCSGPADKLVTFLEVEKFTNNLPIPSGYPDIAELNYLGGHTLAALLAAEKRPRPFS